jgi:hypothetical protein
MKPALIGSTSKRPVQREPARALFEQCHGLREPAVRQTLSELTEEDGYSVMLGYLGITLAYLGYFDEARSKANEGLLEARRLQHAYTLTFCLLFMCEVASLANLPQEVRRHAEEMLDIANEHGFPHFVGYAMTNRGRWFTAVGRQATPSSCWRRGSR